MAEQNRDSSMEEILSSIKRIIAEDKAIDVDAPTPRKRIAKPELKAVPDVPPQETGADDDAEEAEVLELTNEVPADEDNEAIGNAAHGVFGDRRKEERLIDENKLDSMRQSLSALVTGSKTQQPSKSSPAQGTSLEDLTRDLMRPMIKQWLDDNLPALVEELVAREIQRLNSK